MPLYEYECDACGRRFEVIQKFSEMSEVCRKCGKGPVRRLVSSPAIQFKGTGFYITDYAQKDKGRTDDSAGEKSEKSEKGEKSDKGEKADKGESTKTDADKSSKSDGEKKSDAAKSDTTSSSGSTTKSGSSDT